MTIRSKTTRNAATNAASIARRAWALAACCGPLLLAACGSTSDAPKVAAPVLSVQQPGKPVVAVSEANDGAAVLLDRGQVLRVSLPLDTDAVDTNLEWQLADPGSPGVLESLGPTFERTQRNSDPSETAGQTIWRFRPLGPGRTALAFELRRARGLGPPVQTVHYDVTVR